MVLKVFPKGDFLGLLICCSQKKSDQETRKIPFVATSFKSNLRMTGLFSYYVMPYFYCIISYYSRLTYVYQIPGVSGYSTVTTI